MDISSIYNPANQSEEELINSFVAREKELDTLISDIRRNPMKNAPQHYMVQGIRGTGKTTLLLRTYYEIKNDTKLNKWLIPVMFNEEQYSISSLYKLWEYIAQYLPDDNPEFSGLIDKMDQLPTMVDFEMKCFEIIQQSLNEKKKKLVLFIDNFGDLLHKFKKKDEQR